MTHNLGLVFLAIWLIAYGLIAVLGLTFQGIGIVMGVLAIVAGILILIGR